MATVIDSISIKGLRRTHFEQILAYLHRRDYQGEWYYGNQKQFQVRHEEIEAWLTRIIAMLDEEGVKVAK